MEVVFRIRRGDLRRAVRELQVNRGSHNKEDEVTIFVSGYAATFRAPGTDSEYPVDGISPGVARLPITVLKRIADMLGSKEPELRFVNGTVLSGNTSVKHQLIKIGEVPNIRIQVPIDPSPFELIVIGRVLGDDLIAEQGLGARLKSATEWMNQAILRAAPHLAPFGITDTALRALIEAAIDSAKGKIRGGIFS